MNDRILCINIKNILSPSSNHWNIRKMKFILIIVNCVWMNKLLKSFFIPELKRYVYFVVWIYNLNWCNMWKYVNYNIIKTECSVISMYVFKYCVDFMY